MSDNVEFDLDAFSTDLDKTLTDSRLAFQGRYKEHLNQLAGLSRDEIDAVAPGTIDMQKYDELMTLVKAASRNNINQAQLKEQIEKLGGVAINIAQKVPTLAAIL